MKKTFKQASKAQNRGEKKSYILSTDNINVVKEACLNITKNTLVIFDVDDVLMTPKDRILKTKNKFLHKDIIKAFNDAITPEESTQLWSIQWQSRKTTIVNPQFIEIINNLIGGGNRVLLLTNSITGKFGVMPSIEDFRINELKSLGYNISKCWPDIKLTVFTNMAKFIRGALRHPIFKAGIMFTCGCKKGDALREFLDVAEFRPDKIIFIDDKRENLFSVSKFSQAIGVKFFGIEYHESYSLSDEIDEEIACLQFEYLRSNKEWLSDEEAENKLNDGVY